MIVDLSASQKAASDAIKEWFDEQQNFISSHEEEDHLPKSIFRLFGYAGTGKTTTVKYFIENLGLKGDVRFAAYTGKAAMIMRKQGLPAQTIHSLIYRPVPPNEKECNRLFAEIKAENDPVVKKAKQAELKEISKVHFELRAKDNSALHQTCLIVLDECSMVNDEMLNDLLSFNIPMLVLGDPGQLPPIDGEGALTREKPDFMLTEIHRQAKDNPIIDFATRARNGIFIPKIALGSSRHVEKRTIKNSELLDYDQVLCGKNLIRQKLNQTIRSLKGFNDGLYPQVGEKLICLKNNVEKALFNGLMCEVVKVGELLDTSIELFLRLETDPEDTPLTKVNALRAYFEAYQDKEALKNVRWWERADNDEFDFGYAITVHKAQGSQWEKIFFWDDGMYVGWQRQARKKWLYTGLTRAMESVTLAS